MTHVKNRYASFFAALVICFSFVRCSKWVELKPPITNVTQDNAYSSDITATGVLNGIYTTMSERRLSDGRSLNAFMSLWAGLSADEIKPVSNNNGNMMAFYRNNLIAGNTPNIWNETYPFIYIANAVLEGLSDAPGVSPGVKKQLMGEAKFLRGFFYFYLVNLYGKTALPLSTDYNVNRMLARASVDSVYQQIIADLMDAEGMLSEKYFDINVRQPAEVRVAPVKWAATAMLARVYLYRKDYTKAAQKATEVIQQTGLYKLEALNNVFLKTSLESIWQLQPVTAGWDTEDAKYFIIPPTGPNDEHPVMLSPFLMADFETGDLRRTQWVGVFTDNTVTPNVSYYYPYKYKRIPNSTDPDYRSLEYHTVLRLAEQYLIRAEAKIMQHDVAGAKDDLDVIRDRAGLDPTTAATEEDILKAILHEKRIEYFAEWGHRWMDMKRLGTVDAIMTPVTAAKGGTWDSRWQWYPLLQDDLRFGPNLRQNDGY